ncbi:hypothetical protein ACOMHN_024749 [Nucella lapillus]
MRYSRDQLLEIQPSTPNFELVNRLRELRLGRRGCRGGRKKLRSIQVVPSRNLHPLMVPPFLQPHPDLQSAVGNAPLSSKHPTHLPTTDCLLSITPLMGGKPSDAPALSPPSPLQQGGQSSNAPALSPPSPLPQGSQPIALALSLSSPPPQDGQPSDAPGLSPSSSTLLLCPSDSTLSICHLNSQSAVKTVLSLCCPFCLSVLVRLQSSVSAVRSACPSWFACSPQSLLSVLPVRLGSPAVLSLCCPFCLSVLVRLQSSVSAVRSACPSWFACSPQSLLSVLPVRLGSPAVLSLCCPFCLSVLVRLQSSVSAVRSACPSWFACSPQSLLSVLPVRLGSPAVLSLCCPFCLSVLVRLQSSVSAVRSACPSWFACSPQSLLSVLPVRLGSPAVLSLCCPFCLSVLVRLQSSVSAVRSACPSWFACSPQSLLSVLPVCLGSPAVLSLCCPFCLSVLVRLQSSVSAVRSACPSWFACSPQSLLSVLPVRLGSPAVLSLCCPFCLSVLVRLQSSVSAVRSACLSWFACSPQSLLSVLPVRLGSPAVLSLCCPFCLSVLVRLQSSVSAVRSACPSWFACSPQSLLSVLPVRLGSPAVLSLCCPFCLSVLVRLQSSVSAVRSACPSWFACSPQSLLSVLPVRLGSPAVLSLCCPFCLSVLVRLQSSVSAVRSACLSWFACSPQSLLSVLPVRLGSPAVLSLCCPFCLSVLVRLQSSVSAVRSACPSWFACSPQSLLSVLPVRLGSPAVLSLCCPFCLSVLVRLQSSVSAVRSACPSWFACSPQSLLSVLPVRLEEPLSSGAGDGDDGTDLNDVCQGSSLQNSRLLTVTDWSQKADLWTRLFHFPLICTPSASQAVRVAFALPSVLCVHYGRGSTFLAAFPEKVEVVVLWGSLATMSFLNTPSIFSVLTTTTLPFLWKNCFLMKEIRVSMERSQAEDKVENVEIIDVVDPATSTLRSLLNGGGFYDNGQYVNCSGAGLADCYNLTADPAGLLDSMEMERLMEIIVPTIFGVIVLLGLLGNLLVIAVVLSDKHMRNTTNILILSLAVADLLFIVFCVPFTATALALPVWPFGDVWCKVVQYMIHVCAYASVYTLVLMSLDRYLAVVHAIRSVSIRTEHNTWLAVAVTWFVILLGHVPLLFEYGILHYEFYDESRSACFNLAHRSNPHQGKVFASCFLTFGFVVPLGIVCCLYGLMLKRLLYGVVPGGNQSQESIRAKKRVTRMVIIVVIIFAVCWLPIQIILVMIYFNAYPEDKIAYIGLRVASNCLAYMNSCVNPFLYAFLSDNFRRSFRKLLCCGTAPSRRMEYERTNIRYNDKDSKNNAPRSTNHV